MRNFTAVLFVLLLFYSSGAFASELSDQQTHRVLQQWQERVESADALLVEGEWKKAKKKINHLLGEMCDRIQGGDQVDRILATATLLRALAEAGMGNESAADWDLAMVRTLQPALTDLDFSGYGEAGRLLQELQAGYQTADRKEPEGGEMPDKAEIKEMRKKAKAQGTPGMTRPKKTHSPAPKYPYAKFRACLSGPIALQMVIDKEGHPRSPNLLSDQEPLLGYAAMEAIRDWRFKPATLNGEPVETYYFVSVNYSVPGCS